MSSGAPALVSAFQDFDRSGYRFLVGARHGQSQHAPALQQIGAVMPEGGCGDGGMIEDRQRLVLEQGGQEFAVDIADQGECEPAAVAGRQEAAATKPAEMRPPMR